MPSMAVKGDAGGIDFLRSTGAVWHTSVLSHSAAVQRLDIGIPSIYARGLDDTAPETVLVPPCVDSSRLPDTSDPVAVMVPSLS